MENQTAQQPENQTTQQPAPEKKNDTMKKVMEMATKYLAVADVWMAQTMDKVYGKVTGMPGQMLRLAPFSVLVALYMLWNDASIGARSELTLIFVFLPQLIVLGNHFLTKNKK